MRKDFRNLIMIKIFSPPDAPRMSDLLKGAQ
jgi:hypothetical protein